MIATLAAIYLSLAVPCALGFWCACYAGTRDHDASDL